MSLNFNQFSNRIVLPIINRNFNILLTKEGHCALRERTKRRGKKVFENDQRMSWMNSSIDLSQPKINSLQISMTRSNRNLSEDPRSRRSDLKSHKSYTNFIRDSIPNFNTENLEKNYYSSSIGRTESYGKQKQLKPRNERIASHHSNFAQIAGSDYC